MPAQYVKQHIVPKRYLDRFSFDNGNVPIIGTRLNGKGKPQFFTAKTSDVGYIKNYYDVTDKEDTKYWEHYFANQIDTLCGTELENIISTATLSRNNIVILKSKEKSVLAKLIMAQMMRVPNSIEHVKQIYAKSIDNVRTEAFATLPKPILDRYGDQIQKMSFSEQWQKEQFLNHSFSPENFDRYCKLMEERIWVLYVNAFSKEMPFVTSDNPVLVEAVGSNKMGLFHNGLANPATCIFFPISPSIAVASYACNGFVGIVAAELDGKKFILDDLKYIMDKNIKVIEQSFQHSFVPQTLYNELTNKING